MKKILIITKTGISETTPNGNTIINLLNFKNEEVIFGQIVCSEKLPDRKYCNHFFKLTEKEVLKEKFKLNKFENSNVQVPPQKSININKNFIDIEFLKFLIDLFWKIFNFKNKKLINFIKEFDPDIIFSTPHDLGFLYDICEFAVEVSGKKNIIYLTDDVFSLKQLNFSPFFWLRRFYIRNKIRKSASYTDLYYTITKEQKEELSKELKKEIKVIQKGGDFSEENKFNTINNTIKLVYAGGLYLGREETLVKISDILRKINKDKIIAQLNIFSPHTLSKGNENKLNDGNNSIFLGITDLDGVKTAYREADILLHVESFKLKQRLTTRLSFSTKIVDCLEAGKCLFAVGGAENSGLKYLKEEDAAIVVFNPEDLEKTLVKLLNNPSQINEYGNKAWELGKMKHNKLYNRELLLKDIQNLIGK